MIPDLFLDLLRAAAHTIVPDVEVDPLIPCANPLHGDYQWNFAFRMAKPLKANPRALAERLLPLLDHPAIVAKSVAGPGFINLKLSDSWLYTQAQRQANDPAFGTSPTGAGKTVVIDFSSPNVAKRMHIGHMRSTHIGHALCGLHRAAGWTVVGDNHIGDWGTQFGKLIVAYHLWLDPSSYAEDPIGELERIYVFFGNEVAVNDSSTPEKRAEATALMDRARAETLKLQRGDAENTALWKEFLQVSLAEFELVYRRMGVRFDVVLGESAYAGQMDEMVERLVQTGLAEESQGALIIRFTEPELKDHPMIVRKKDGAANYATTDLACIRYREDRWNPAKILYVTDMRQQLHFQQLFAVARRWELRPELIHAWFGMLVLPEGAMSTRKGNVIRLVDLLDEAVRRARAVVDQKSPDLPEEERAKIAEAVGVSAVRYADLSQHPQTNITFDWDRMLSLEGNTAPYLLYSHARCASLLARAGNPSDLAALCATEALERTLLLTAMRTPEAVQAALRSVRPNLLCDHLFELANQFNHFYHDFPVLTGGEHREARLALVELSRRALRFGLERLGLTILDRM